MGKPYKIKTSKLCCNKKKKNKIIKIAEGDSSIQDSAFQMTPRVNNSFKGKINRVMDES